MRNAGSLCAFAALILGVVSISWSAIFVRWTEMPGVASAFYRVLIASVVLWGLLFAQRREGLRVERRTISLAAIAGVFFAADVGCYNVAVRHTSAASATFLGNNAPLMVGLLTWLATRRLPSGRFWLALVIASMGAGLIVSVDFQQVRSEFVADMLAVVASICFAMYLMFTERVRTHAETAMTVVLSTTASAVALGVFAVSTRTSLALPDVRSLLAVIGLGLVCQLTGYFCLTYALGHLPATVSSIVMLMVAPLTAVLAWLLFKEAMTPLQMLGGGFILLAVWTVSRPAKTSVSISNA